MGGVGSVADCLYHSLLEYQEQDHGAGVLGYIMDFWPGYLALLMEGWSRSPGHRYRTNGIDRAHTLLFNRLDDWP